MNLRFTYVVLSSSFFVMYAIPKANRMIEDKETYSDMDRFLFAKKIANHMKKRARTTTIVTGKENIPKVPGTVFYSNHQGKYDALGILLEMDEPCSVLWEKKQASKILSKQECELLDGVPIDLTSTKEKVKSILQVIDKIKSGKNMLIFPEGGYKDNKNTMQKFMTGCFSCSLKTKTPIVPVAIYDAYKSMNSNTFEKVTTQVHFLKPIYAEEYEHMSKVELSELVKERIQQKLDEIEENK